MAGAQHRIHGACTCVNACKAEPYYPLQNEFDDDVYLLDLLLPVGQPHQSLASMLNWGVIAAELAADLVRVHRRLVALLGAAGR
jgi:hypothetical protein